MVVDLIGKMERIKLLFSSSSTFNYGDVDKQTNSLQHRLELSEKLYVQIKKAMLASTWSQASPFVARKYYSLCRAWLLPPFFLFTPPSSPELPERGRTVPAIIASGWRNHRPAHPAHGAARLHSAASFPPDSGSSAPNDP